MHQLGAILPAFHEMRSFCLDRLLSQERTFETAQRKNSCLLGEVLLYGV